MYAFFLVSPLRARVRARARAWHRCFCSFCDERGCWPNCERRFWLTRLQPCARKWKILLFLISLLFLRAAPVPKAGAAGRLFSFRTSSDNYPSRMRCRESRSCYALDAFLYTSCSLSAKLVCACAVIIPGLRERRVSLAICSPRLFRSSSSRR